MKYLSFCYVKQRYSVIIDVPIHFSQFLCKAYSKVGFGHAKIFDAIFLGQSLLLSTTVLNDIVHSRVSCCTEYLHIYVYVHSYIRNYTVVAS